MYHHKASSLSVKLMDLLWWIAAGEVRVDDPPLVRSFEDRAKTLQR